MIRKLMISAGVTALLALSPTLVPTPAHAEETKQPTAASNADTYRLLNLFGDVFDRVRADYVEPVSEEEMIEAALNGMLASLDPHSNYMNAKAYRDMQVQIRGEFDGLGIEVTMEQGWVKVVSPIDDTPASKAGLHTGDFITHLNGDTVQGLTLNEAVDRMRGPPNTDIRLTIRREGQAPFDVTLTRAVIHIQTVKSKLLPGNIGYIRLTQFAENTSEGLTKAIDQIKKDAKTKPAGYILDLRNNPGGLLGQAVGVSSDFLANGQEVVTTRARRAEDTQRLDARGGDITGGAPLVVLINDGSASASEIVAGALQDHHRATLMGSKSFGKGSVQTIIEIPSSHGALRLTTARYYTPSGRSIQALGIEPDIKVPVTKDGDAAAAAAEDDGMTRSEASLPHALKNDTVKADDKPAADKPADDKKDGDKKDADKKKTKAAPAFLDPQKVGDPATDYQLSRAMDQIKLMANGKSAKAN